jgi:penicillin amidase
MRPRPPALLMRVTAALLALALVAASLIAIALRASLPQLDGEQFVPGLRHATLVLRDDAGVPTVRAADRADAAYALGYLHAQDRYFQMDLLRRSAAGELAALMGEGAVEQDLSSRRFLFRRLAGPALASLPEVQRQILARYTAGVNTGLAALGARPFEYIVLGQAPRPWLEEDSLLVIWSMYQRLQGHIEPRELARRWLRMNSTPAQYAAMLPAVARFDAPLDAGGIARPVPLPQHAPGWMGASGAASNHSGAGAARGAVGSNAMAVGGTRTGHGGALLANDMHLPLALPNHWYRVQLEHPAPHGARRLVGLTLPGVPVMVVGSNGVLAWGLTNAFADTMDLVEATPDPGQPGRYRIGSQEETLSAIEEQIEVRGAATRTLKVLMSSRGPLSRIEGWTYVVTWTAREAGAVNLGMLDLESIDSVGGAIATAPTWGIPAQNALFVDSGGRIGWTVAGVLPRRKTPGDIMADDGDGWSARLPSGDYPTIQNPAGDVLWSANSRQLAGDRQGAIGDGGADIGARATQIRDALLARPSTDEAGMMDVMLDDRAHFVGVWRDLALRALTPAALDGQPERQALRTLLLSGWTGRAEKSSAAYTLSRSYLYALYEEIFGAVDVRLAVLPGTPNFAIANPRWPAVVERLLTERPGGWLAGRTWEQLELAAIDRAIQHQRRVHGSLNAAMWGGYNAAAIGHPLAGLPLVGSLLRAPPDPQSGDDHMPRVANPDFGQSQRLVVSPGREEFALFNMPGGQSGHPWSPFFLAGHEAWSQGDPVALLPGPERHRLLLRPR